MATTSILTNSKLHDLPDRARRTTPTDERTGSERRLAQLNPIKAAFQDARRRQGSVFSGPERRALTWMAHRMPDPVNSDHLTLLGFVAMFLTGVSYALARWSQFGLLSATVFLALNWLGDSLDGTLARVRHHERPRYGFYVDHVLDTFGTLFIMAGLALSGYVDWRIAAGMLVAFLMLAIEVYLTTYTIGEFHLSFWKFGPTELRLLLAAANIVLWFRPQARVFGLPYRLLDFGGCVAVAGMMIALIVATILHTARLYRAERLP